MVRYSFLVRLFHPLLHAGLSRRTNISIALRIAVFTAKLCFAIVASLLARLGTFWATSRQDFQKNLSKSYSSDFLARKKHFVQPGLNTRAVTNRGRFPEPLHSADK